MMQLRHRVIPSGYVWPMYTTAGGAGEFRCHSPVAYKLSLWRYGALCRDLYDSLPSLREVTAYLPWALCLRYFLHARLANNIRRFWRRVLTRPCINFNSSQASERFTTARLVRKCQDLVDGSDDATVA